MLYPSALLFPGTPSSFPAIEPDAVDDATAALAGQVRYGAVVATDDRYRARIALPADLGGDS